jgi:hypothetical protein
MGGGLLEQLLRLRSPTYTPSENEKALLTDLRKLTPAHLSAAVRWADERNGAAARQPPAWAPHEKAPEVRQAGTNPADFALFDGSLHLGESLVIPLCPVDKRSADEVFGHALALKFGLPSKPMSVGGTCRTRLGGLSLESMQATLEAAVDALLSDARGPSNPQSTSIMVKADVRPAWLHDIMSVSVIEQNGMVVAVFMPTKGAQVAKDVLGALVSWYGQPTGPPASKRGSRGNDPDFKEWFRKGLHVQWQASEGVPSVFVELRSYYDARLSKGGDGKFRPVPVRATSTGRNTAADSATGYQEHLELQRANEEYRSNPAYEPPSSSNIHCETGAGCFRR